MVGPEGKEYTEVLTTKLGKLGFRAIPSGFRVRLEPRVTDLVSVPKFQSSSWKRPDSSGNRYSIVVGNTADLASAIASGAAAISAV